MKTNYQLQNIAAASQDQAFIDQSAVLTAVTSSPSAGQFLSSITGRSAIPDIANDFRASLGIERILVQQIMLLQNEFGPNGEPVYSALNDTRNLIRFVGNWTASGTLQVRTSVIDEYVEVVFYGTGLNLLDLVDGAARQYRVSVDGAAETSADLTGSAVLYGRGYMTNQVRNICSVSLGLHTVKIRNQGGANGLTVFGFEILNTNASGLVNINPGTAYYRGQKIKNTSADSIAYNTGVTGTKGGRIVRYFTGNDTPTQAFTATDTTAKYLTNTDHTNEEIARTYNWREFGAGRYSPADDFSLYTGGTAAKSFTLDDGTTTLEGAAGGVASESIYTDNNQFLTFTFIGTGVDVDLGAGAGGAKTDTVQVWIDGTNVGNMPTTNNTNITVKLASGLAYGSHTLKLLRTVNSSGVISYKNFKAYQPKKPSLPTGAIEIADYNVPANHVQNNTVGIETISTGILRKGSSREFVYVNGTGGSGDWSHGQGDGPSATIGLQRSQTDRLNAYFEYTFFGTGFEYRGACRSDTSASILVTINGSAATTTNFPSITAWTYGTGIQYSGLSGTSITPTTNVFDCTDATAQTGVGMGIKGLTLGKYTVRFTNNAGGSWIFFEAIDFIVPIHSYKSNLYADLQNTLPVGSQSLMDSRQTSPIPNSLSVPKAWAQAVGVTSDPSTGATSAVPMPDMSVTIKTNGGILQISHDSQLRNANTGQYNYIKVYLDGIAIATRFTQQNSATYIQQMLINLLVSVYAGIHKVDIYWYTSASTLTADGTGRILTVQEK